ncbi:MAG: hypothetical protein AB1847_18475 [bacterium]
MAQEEKTIDREKAIAEIVEVAKKYYSEQDILQFIDIMETALKIILIGCHVKVDIERI